MPSVFTYNGADAINWLLPAAEYHYSLVSYILLKFHELEILHRLTFDFSMLNFALIIVAIWSSVAFLGTNT